MRAFKLVPLLAFSLFCACAPPGFTQDEGESGEGESGDGDPGDGDPGDGDSGDGDGDPGDGDGDGAEARWVIVNAGRQDDSVRQIWAIDLDLALAGEPGHAVLDADADLSTELSKTPWGSVLVSHGTYEDDDGAHVEQLRLDDQGQPEFEPLVPPGVPSSLVELQFSANGDRMIGKQLFAIDQYQEVTEHLWAVVFDAGTPISGALLDSNTASYADGGGLLFSGIASDGSAAFWVPNEEVWGPGGPLMRASLVDGEPGPRELLLTSTEVPQSDAIVELLANKVVALDADRHWWQLSFAEPSEPVVGPAGDNGHLRWHPDGDWACHEFEQDVYAMFVGTSFGEPMLVSSPELPPSTHGCSFVSDRLVYGVGESLESSRPSMYAQVDLSGDQPGPALALTSEAAEGVGPSWTSPNARWYGYVSNEVDTRRLEIVDISSPVPGPAHVLQIVAGEGSLALTFADDQWALFVAQGALYTVDLDVDAPTPVLIDVPPGHAVATSVTVTPSADAVVFRTSSADTTALWHVDVDGATPATLLDEVSGWGVSVELLGD